MIYVAIPTFMDEEISNTVTSLLENSYNINNIFVSVFSQDFDEKHQDLESIFNNFNFKNYLYIKENYLKSTGVGYARMRAQEGLSLDYKYYLQVDSHSIFIKNWDKELVELYHKTESYWGDHILTSYPLGYKYVNEDIEYENSEPLTVYIHRVNGFNRFSPNWSKNYNLEFGQESGFFCAGFAFGYSEYFLDTPYDTLIHFLGEEQTMSLRFYEKQIKLICSPKNFIYHNYDTDKRKKMADYNYQQFEYLEKNSKKRIIAFFNGKVEKPYGISSHQLIDEYLNCFEPYGILIERENIRDRKKNV